MRALVLATWIVAALVTSAHAGDRTKAEQYFRAAEKAFRAQKFGAAAESFERAYQELPLPEIAFSAAQAYRRYYYVDLRPELAKRAAELYRLYLDGVKEGGRVADASDALAEMQRIVERAGAKMVAMPTLEHRKVTQIAIGAIVEGEQQKTEMRELSGIPADDALGARAMLDGKPVKLYDWIEVTPAEHTIEVSAPGYFPGTLKKRILDGESDVVEVTLKPRPATIAITTEAGATVTIDGRVVRGARAEVPAGRRLVTVTRRGREAEQREVVVARGETRTLDIALSRTTKRRAVPWVLAGTVTAAALTGVAVGFALAADGEMSDLAAKRDREGITADELGDYEAATTRRDRMRDAAWVLGGTTLATGAIAAALYLFDTPGPSASRGDRMIIPSATANGVGATVVGRF